LITSGDCKIVECLEVGGEPQKVLLETLAHVGNFGHLFFLYTPSGAFKNVYFFHQKPTMELVGELKTSADTRDAVKHIVQHVFEFFSNDSDLAVEVADRICESGGNVSLECDEAQALKTSLLKYLSTVEPGHSSSTQSMACSALNSLIQSEHLYSQTVSTEPVIRGYGSSLCALSIVVGVEALFVLIAIASKLPSVL
jgi:hypothetical protein